MAQWETIAAQIKDGQVWPHMAQPVL